MLVQEQLCLAEILEQEGGRALWPAAKGSAMLKALLTRAKAGSKSWEQERGQAQISALSSSQGSNPVFQGAGCAPGFC